MRKKFYLLPGEFVVTVEVAEITTILGSCVSVALTDSRAKVTGICHYLLARINESPGSILRYGDQAIPILIDEMINLGANPKNLVAKVFGGAKVLDYNTIGANISRDNIAVAHEILAQYRIPILQEQTGGHLGRKLHLSSDTFEVEQQFIMRTSPHTEAKKKQARTLRVALIDPASYYLTYLNGLMNQSGFSVVGAASDSFDACRLLTEEKPDLVIFGIQNDGKRGLQLIRDLKKMTDVPQFFIYSSGGNGNQDSEAMDLGAVDTAHSESNFNLEMLDAAGALLVEKIKAKLQIAC